MAKVIFNYGSMNSGKSLKLCSEAFNYEERGMKVYTMKPLIDTRDTMIKSRALAEDRRVNFLIDGADRFPTKYFELTDQHVDAIFVDEAQFLTKQQVRDLAKIAKVDNIPVLCYGIRTDFQGELFPGSAELLAIADELNEIPNICWCGKKARMNARVVDGRMAVTGDQVQVGGNESYVALCYGHFIEGNLGKKNNPGN